eukprot:Opistho-2@92926
MEGSKRPLRLFLLGIALILAVSTPVTAFKSACPPLLAGVWRATIDASTNTSSIFSYSCDSVKMNTTVSGVLTSTRSFTMQCAQIDGLYSFVLLMSNSSSVRGEFSVGGTLLSAQLVLAAGDLDGAAANISASGVIYNKDVAKPLSGSAYITSALCLADPNDSIFLPAGLYPSIRPAIGPLRFVGEGQDLVKVNYVGTETFTARTKINYENIRFNFASGIPFTLSGASVEFKNCILALGTTSAVVCDTSSFLNITTTTIFGSGSTLSAAAIRLVACVANVVNSTIHDVEASSNGACLAAGRTTILTVSGSNFVNCVAGGNGGGIYASSSSSVTITRSYFEACWSDNMGAAVYVRDVPSTWVSDTIFHTNEGAIHAGALAAQDTTSVTTGVQVVVNITSCQFLGNRIWGDSSAYGEGAAIYFNGKKIEVTISYSQFVENDALNSDYSDGGVAVIEGSAVVTYSGCLFQGNQGYYSGVTWARGFTRIVYDSCIFIENVGIIGGTAYIESSALLTVSQCNFIGNTASNGGTIYGGAQVVDSIFENNKARKSGAVAFVPSINSMLTMTNCIFRGNTAREAGGLVYVDSMGRLDYRPCVTVTGGSASSNTANIGGLFFVKSGLGEDREQTPLPPPSDDTPNLVVEDFSVSSSRATEGGVVAATAGGVVVFRRLTGSNNAANFGGVGHISDNSRILCTDCSLQKSSGSSGGAFFVTGKGVLTLLSSRVERSIANGGGGGISMLLDGSLVMSNSSGMGNGALYGGFLAMSGRSTAFISDSTIAWNMVDDYAGAISLSANSALSLSNVSVSSNCAVGQGGAIRIEGSAALVANPTDAMATSATFANNGASEGGALYVRNGATVKMVSAVLRGNTGDKAAGAVFVTDCGTLDLQSALMTENVVEGGDGGAIFFEASSTVSISRSNVTENSAENGGAVCGRISSAAQQSSCRTEASPYVGIDAALEASRGYTCKGSIPTLTVVGSVFSSNVAEEDGGAIAMTGGRLRVTANTLIDSNTATSGRGGGLFFERQTVNSTGNVAFNQVYISNNKAGTTGGGIHIYKMGEAFFANVTVTRNSADVGGGIFNSNPSSLVQNQSLVLFGNMASLYGTDKTSPGTTLKIKNLLVSGDLSLPTGGTMPSFALELYDAYDVLAKSGGSNYEIKAELKAVTAPTVRPQDPALELRGSEARNLDGGKATFVGMRLFGSPGSYNLTFSVTNSPGVSITLPVTLVACESLGDNVIYQGSCVQVFSENQGLRNAFLALCAIGEVLAIVIFVFIVIYRSQDIIKASSPMFCSIIVAGCMLGYATVFTMVPTASNATCGLNIWFGHLAFTITFSALFAKNFRIMAIFNNRKMRQRLRATSDIFLLSIVAVVCSLCVIYLIIWSAVDIPERTAKFDASKNELRYTCESSSSVWAIVLYAAEAASLAWGVYLAWRTKAVPSKFRESKYIALSIWNITVIAVIILPLNYTVDQSNPDTQFLFTSVGLFVATTGTLVLIFGPKAYMYITQDTEAAKSGMTSASRTSSMSQGGSEGSTVDGQVNELRVQKMEMDNMELKNKYDTAVKENMDLWDQIDRLHRQVDQLQQRVRDLTGGGEDLVAPNETYRAARPNRSSLVRFSESGDAASGSASESKSIKRADSDTSSKPSRGSDALGVSSVALIVEASTEAL